MRVSIVVDNFNNERFLATAIESALDQTHDDIEVVVVDDGSTDASREIIDGYRARPGLRVVLKDNGGQASAINAGYAAADGDLVIFLDGDDFLHSDCAASADAAYEPGCAKVMWRLTTVDSDGNRTGCDPPAGIPMPQGDVVPEVLRRGRYVCSVTDGNAFPRATLDALFPIPEADFRISADGYFNPLCVFLGPTVSVDDELAAYRQHGANLWSFTSDITADRLRAKLAHDRTLRRYLERAAADHGLRMEPGYLDHDSLHLVHRLALRRLDGVPTDGSSETVPRLLRLALASLRGDEGTLPDRLYLALEIIALGIVPRRWAPPVVQWILQGRPKPAWLRSIARVVRT